MEPGSEAWMTLNRMGNAFEAAQEDEVAHPTGCFRCYKGNEKSVKLKMQIAKLRNRCKLVARGS